MPRWLYYSLSGSGPKLRPNTSFLSLEIRCLALTSCFFRGWGLNYQSRLPLGLLDRQAVGRSCLGTGCRPRSCAQNLARPRMPCRCLYWLVRGIKSSQKTEKFRRGGKPGAQGFGWGVGSGAPAIISGFLRPLNASVKYNKATAYISPTVRQAKCVPPLHNGHSCLAHPHAGQSVSAPLPTLHSVIIKGDWRKITQTFVGEGKCHRMKWVGSGWDVRNR